MILAYLALIILRLTEESPGPGQPERKMEDEMALLKALLILFGVIVLVIILLIGIGISAFNRQITREIDELAESVEGIPPGVVDYEDLRGLPRPVQSYLKFALKDGQPYIQVARLKQTGVFKPSEGADWAPIEAEQYFATEDPAFVWVARLKMGAFFWVTARDMYSYGKGNMLIKPVSAVTILDASGKEIDESSFIRYFAEAPWFPSALLPSEYVSWEELDSRRAKATFRHRGHTASGMFTFGDQGQILSFVTHDRFRDAEGRYYKEQWTGYYGDYEEIQGVRIPTKVEAEWNLENWDFKYLSFTVTDIEFDNASRY